MFRIFELCCVIRGLHTVGAALNFWFLAAPVDATNDAAVVEVFARPLTDQWAHFSVGTEGVLASRGMLADIISFPLARKQVSDNWSLCSLSGNCRRTSSE